VTDNPDSTNPSSPKPLDVVERLYVLASAIEVANSPKPELAVAALARDAAEEIIKLRRRIEGLEMRLNNLQE
jgi:hypothetical protein